MERMLEKTRQKRKSTNEIEERMKDGNVGGNKPKYFIGG
jgi:hypothetical protein